MDRRRLLRAVAALPVLGAGCLSGLPTATGPRSGPTPERTPGERVGSVVEDIGVESTDDDRLAVVLTVRNRGVEPTEARVVATVTAGGEEFVRETTVRVGPETTTTTRVAFDVPFEEFSGDGSVSARVA